ncbi:MAG TPA: UDP-N-acetylmuramoyl-tripeptide--D-alanyl-D-alanine ligase [Opitutaceae bacterium]|jgi:UDP-N-acetylmuramoyl-tripeptide--D-alanyl-D-alanine ligase|nr:UDP-N-acetylmuramoyl-tripeptide--D-alanyl-D-alanine ligase [Opitutaceae bacterium]
MSVFSPSQLAAWTGGTWTAQPAMPLRGFAIDSRLLAPGQVFVALKTDKRDGHKFLKAAEAGGASAAMVALADPHSGLPQLVVPDPLAAFQTIAREHRRNFTGKVIGISGSCGKTSTKNLLALLLGEESGDVLATEGNLNNHLGVPLTLTRINPALHKFAVVEAGISAPGEMAPLARMIEPDLALITLIAPAHIEELGDLDGVAREKVKLPIALRASGIAVFPRQCAELTPFRELGVRTLVVEPAEVLRPAEPPKDRVFFAVSHRDDNTVVAIAYGAPPPLIFTLRRISNGMAQNAALAICSALWLGVPHQVVQERLASWQPAQWRGELRQEEGRSLYLDCYNANPASMADALEMFFATTSPDEPRLLVLGGMEELGERAADYHCKLGLSLCLGEQDQVVLIGPHARDVQAGAIVAGSRPDQIHIVGSIDAVRTRLAGFHGAVFMKGSRRHALETALEPSRLPVEAENATC